MIRIFISLNSLVNYASYIASQRYFILEKLLEFPTWAEEMHNRKRVEER
jgi:hypothetical protein